jgi:cyanate permease
VAAATPAILTKSTTLRVSLPILLIALTAVGGLIGGVMAFWTKRTRWWRIVIGLFTGFVLYWAMIFGLLQSIPRAAALNPLSAFAVAIIGGYMGPQLLGIMAQRFGVGPSTAPAVRSTHRQPKTSRDSHAKNPG